jgi:putative ABC transport system permease protein
VGYTRDKNLGFDKEHVVVIERAGALGQQLEALKVELLKDAHIISAAASNTLPGKLFGRETYQPEGTPAGTTYPMLFCTVDHDFVKTLGMELVAGRDFSRKFATDSSAIIVNEAAVKMLGWDDPIGKHVQSGRTFTVIGVVKDFHFESLHREIRPLAIHLGSFTQLLSVRVRPDNVSRALAFLEEKWRSFAPDQPFEFSFLDEDFDRLYRAEQRTGKIFGAFSILSILIACLGLFGLAAFTAEHRTKEIGVRKVLGASVPNLAGLLSKEFVRLVLLANLIAWPIAWYAMHQWLQDFAYRIDINWWVFTLAGGLALVIALLTVSTQAIKAALANPVEALRYE